MNGSTRITGNEGTAALPLNIWIMYRLEFKAAVGRVLGRMYCVSPQADGKIVDMRKSIYKGGVWNSHPGTSHSASLSYFSITSAALEWGSSALPVAWKVANICWTLASYGTAALVKIVKARYRQLHRRKRSDCGLIRYAAVGKFVLFVRGAEVLGKSRTL